MRTTASGQLALLTLASITAVILLSSPLQVGADQAGLAIHLTNGQGQSYELAEIERITFTEDSVIVRSDGSTDGFLLPTILRLDFEHGTWTGVDGLEPDGEEVSDLCLFQNHPNPFSLDTRVEFALPAEVHVTLRIYTISGRLVCTLLEGEREAGPHSVMWDGNDSLGRPVASGVYLYALVTDGVEKNRKMLLLR